MVGVALGLFTPRVFTSTSPVVLHAFLADPGQHSSTLWTQLRYANHYKAASPSASQAITGAPDPFGWGTNVATITYTCVAGDKCVGAHVHFDTISRSDRATGNFSGTGYEQDVFVRPGDRFTENIAGDLSSSGTLTWHILYTGILAGYTVDGTAHRAADGSFVGTALDSNQDRFTAVLNNAETYSTSNGGLPSGTSSSIYNRTVLADHPVAYWPLDDTAKSIPKVLTAKDLTGHGHDGQYMGGVQLASPNTDNEVNPFGLRPAAASFDGKSGYVNIPGTWGGPSWKAVTVEAWVYAQVQNPPAVKPTDYNFQAIVEPTDQSFVHFQLHPPCRVEDECGDVVYVDAGTRAILLPVVSPSSPPAWHYVVMTGQSSDSKIYVDGVEQGSNSSTFTSITAANSLRIGSGYRGGRFFNGRIADVAIYDHALDAVQVADHYNVAKGLSSGSDGGVVVFVHGIMGDYTRMGLDLNNLDYTALLSNVLAAGYAIKPFAYYEDTGLAMGHHIGYGCSPQQYTPLSHALIDEIRQQRALYVDADATSHLEASQPQDILNLTCNSESDLATNVVMLDHFLNTIASHSTKITVMVHSMGGAITRGWLAYAQYREDHGDYDPALHHVKSVIFMQGAQQGATGAWLGSQCQVGWQFDFWSLLYQALCHAGGAELVQSFSHLDGLSAASRELVPGSAWYRQTNSLPLPRGIHYFNFYSDIRVRPFLKADPDHPIYPQMVHAGDLVMPPGSDDPHAIGTENLNTSSDFYPNGGARFCPPPDCHEWQIEDGSELGPGSADVAPYPFPLQIASIGPAGFIYHGPYPLHAGPVVQRILHDGATHFNFGGSGMGALMVNVSDCNNPATYHLRRLVTQVMAILRDPTAVCAQSAETVGSATMSNIAGNPLGSFGAGMVSATAGYQPTGAHGHPQQTLSSKAAQPAAALLVLRDRVGREAFTFYPKKAVRRYASPYSFSVAGVGLYLGQIIVIPKLRNTASIQAHGLARWVRSGRVDVRLSLRIGGHIDLASGQATLDIQVFRPHASYRYHLQTVGVQPRAVQPLVRRVDALIQSRHLSALYPLLPSLFQTAAVRLQLAHSSVHTRGTPTILAMTSTGGGQVVQTSLGYSFYVQPIVVRERNSSGVERTYTSALEFIWINGAWRFWSSE